jgi:hypothetical protein
VHSTDDCSTSTPVSSAPAESGTVSQIVWLLRSATSLESRIGLGLATAYLAGTGAPHYLLYVPLSIVLCGAALGVGRALQEGLYERVRRALSRRQRSKRPGTGGSSSGL